MMQHVNRGPFPDPNAPTTSGPCTFYHVPPVKHHCWLETEENPHYQKFPLHLITGCSRAGGYNPTRVHIDGHIKEQFDPHPELSAVSAAVYSNANIRRLQSLIAAAGFGYVRPFSLKPYLDYAMRYDRGVFNPDCYMNSSDLGRTVDEQVEAVNGRALMMIRPILESTKFGLENYYKDISRHSFPDNPIASPFFNRKSDTLIFPYYNSLS